MELPLNGVVNKPLSAYNLSPEIKRSALQPLSNELNVTWPVTGAASSFVEASEMD
jgi:hypothetical protein